ncbi:hypothetical protein Aduo_016718 [Ancylostoma duodenale]
MESVWKRSSEDPVNRSADIGSSEDVNVKDEFGKGYPSSAESAERRERNADLIDTVPRGGFIETAQRAGSAEHASRETVEKPKPAKMKARKAAKTKTHGGGKGKKGRTKLKVAKTRSSGGKDNLPREEEKESH